MSQSANTCQGSQKLKLSKADQELDPLFLYLKYGVKEDLRKLWCFLARHKH